MILAMAWKSLTAHPVRTTVLGVGFGLGVSVMATLLGVGEVVLEQARAPALAGGGDLLVTGLAGPVSTARFVLGRLRTEPTVKASSPRRRAELFLVRPDGATLSVSGRGGIPSLERALGDPETAGVASWVDTSRDAAWADPDPAQVLRAMDRFHPVPDVPARAHSWAEWLYFKGRSGDLQFYLTFLVGPKRADGARVAGVRLQLDRNGQATSYGASDTVDEAAILAAAPDLTIAGARVRLEGLRYHVTFDLPRLASPDRARAVGDLWIEGDAGRSLPPIELAGAGGWISGYTVPVMAGRLGGTIVEGETSITLSGSGYHDHNWGFWEGVSWRWGQVAHADQSYVYGRIIPPPDAADPSALPGFLMAIGPDGPVGFATQVAIEERDDPRTGQPRRIIVTGRARDLELRLTADIESAIVNRSGPFAGGPDFLQLRARYHVSGRVGDRAVDFHASGAAETFREPARGAAPGPSPSSR